METSRDAHIEARRMAKIAESTQNRILERISNSREDLASQQFLHPCSDCPT
jgi:hypothetical protein